MVGWGAGAVKGVGFGPQIKFGATDLGGGAWEVGRGLGAVLGEIPAAERGYDGALGRDGSWGLVVEPDYVALLDWEVD